MNCKKTEKETLNDYLALAYGVLSFDTKRNTTLRGLTQGEQKSRDLIG